MKIFEQQHLMNESTIVKKKRHKNQIVFNGLSLFMGISSLYMHPSYSMDEINLLELEASLNKIQQQVINFAQAYPNADENLMVFGKLGVGKTALHNFIAERTLTAQPASIGFKLHASSPLDGFEISHTGRGTIEPCFWYDAKRNRKCFDFPGHNDPGGYEKEISNSYFSREFVKNQVGVKILFAIPERDFDLPRCPNLSERLGEIVNYFRSDEELKDALGIVITMQRDVNPDTIFQSILETANDSPTSHINHNLRVRELVRHLANNSSTRVAAFPTPTNLAPYNAPHALERILRMINELTPISNPHINIAVSPGAREAVGLMGQKLNISLTNYIRTEEAKLIKNYCMEKMINFSQGSVSILREEFKVFSDQLKNIVNLISEHQPLAFANQLRGILQADPLSPRIKSIEFLKSINNTIPYDTGAWGGALTDTIEQIKNLSVVPQYEYGNGIFSLKGILLGTSDIIRSIENMPIKYPINILKIYSYNALFLDQDITLSGTLLSMISPYLKVIEPRCINLSGAHGMPPVADAVPRQHGLPGTHGQHGGHLYINAHIYGNINDLSVNTIGGNGGPGGKGGNGFDGSDGLNGDLTKITTQDPISIILHKGIGGMEKEELQVYHYEDQGTDGKSGGVPGKGGIGGLKGLNGTTHIENQWGNNLHNAIAINGTNGDHGTPGLGGIHGQHCKGKKYQYTIRHLFYVTESEREKRNRAAELEKVCHVGDRGRAASGDLPESYNTDGQQPQPMQIPLDYNSLKQEYILLYNQAKTTNTLIRNFPNIQ